jgi:aminoglycoside phosphotransferase (APT) family kinase protein
MSDPTYVSEMVARVAPPGDPLGAQARTTRYSVQCIRYRPGRRHVLRYDSLDSPESGTVFAKMYAGQKGEQAFRVATIVADWLAQHGQGVTSLRPLAYLAEDAVVLYRKILGQSLSQYLQTPSQGVGQNLRAVGVALRALHELPQELIGPLKPHDLAAEIKQIKRSGEHLPTLLPAAGAAVRGMLGRAIELDAMLPSEPPTFTHGDFISEHIWVTSEGLIFIDFDNCFLADPALDIGKFLADLQLMYANYDLPGVEEAQEMFLSGYFTGKPNERLIRARLYEAIKLAKMAARRVYVFEHDWASRTAYLIERAQSLMSSLEHSLGLPTRQVSA